MKEIKSLQECFFCGLGEDGANIFAFSVDAGCLVFVGCHPLFRKNFVFPSFPWFLEDGVITPPGYVIRVYYR